MSDLLDKFFFLILTNSLKERVIRVIVTLKLKIRLKEKYKSGVINNDSLTFDLVNTFPFLAHNYIKSYSN